MLFRKFLIAVSLLFAASNCVAASLQDLKTTYVTAGQEIVDMVNAGNVDVGRVEANVLLLTKTSVALAQQYIEMFPEGKALLSEAINNVAVVENGQVVALGPMAKESFDHIEKHWHDLGYLEGKDYGVDMDDEDNEHFTDPLHVMVHPLMVLRAAQDNNTDAMKAEMEEGMEQIELTVDNL